MKCVLLPEFAFVFSLLCSVNIYKVNAYLAPIAARIPLNVSQLKSM